LKLLQTHIPNQLPLDPRTLRHTPRNLDVHNVSGGQFVYFGVTKSIDKRLNSGRSLSMIKTRMFLKIQSQCKNRLISISIGIDGIPLSGSSKHEFWPILGLINQIDSSVFVIGIFYGKSKPSNLDFLNLFVEEMLELENQGVTINSVKYDVRISSVITDTPARSLVKSVKLYNSYYGCDKCIQKGEWVGRIVYPELISTVRTDLDFKTSQPNLHHTGDCILSQLQIGLVSQVPLDYMHLVCLGVVRKVVRRWVKGKLPHRLPGRTIAKISERLSVFKKFLPSGFQRRPRPLNEIDHYKATEFRTLILYTALPAFLKLVPRNYLNHFLLLHTAMFILLSLKADDEQWNELAHNLLVRFFEEGKDIYGIEFCVFNVHGLLHLSEDAKNFGNLDNISAFPFESYMQNIKRMKKSNSNYLIQVANRICEREELELNPKVKESSKLLSSDRGNNCFALTCGDVILISEIIKCNSDMDVEIICKKFHDKRRVKFYPLDSLKLGICHVSNLSNNLKLKISLSQILYKCVLLPNDKDYLCLPLIHTIK